VAESSHDHLWLLGSLVKLGQTQKDTTV
jgi:hypothetical protein